MFPLNDSTPRRSFPFVNYTFIAINIAIFLKEFQLAAAGQLEPFIQTYGLIPSRFFADPVAGIPDVLTSMFLHGSWGHVLGNMWFLHVFGDNVEDNVGHIRYFFYYLLMGLGAAAAQVAFNPQGTLPMVGASGAIAGILGSYIVLHPRARVTTFFFYQIVQVPAFFFLGLWFVIQAVNGVGSIAVTATRGEMGGVAWWAHAGGFLAGFIAIPFLKRHRH